MGTRKVHDIPGRRHEGIVAAINEIIAGLQTNGVFVHGKRRDPVTLVDATDVATTVALANALKAAYNLHRQDTDEHVAADATNPVTSADATDQTTANTLLNEIKTDFNAHIVLAASHLPLGGEGRIPLAAVISTANATDAATSQALANALKKGLNAHFSQGAQQIQIIAS